MAYAYRRAISIDHTKVPGDLSNFPVLVSGTYSYLATVANGGKVQSASGHDIAFFSDAALTTQLKHEIERWVAATGEVIYWVKLPSVSSSVDTVFYIAYGDAGISSTQADPTNVWDSNFKGVWHLPDGTTLSANDSTGNANNGSISGPVAASGKMGGGALFDGVNDYLDMGGGSSLRPTTAITMEAWVNINGAQGAYCRAFNLPYSTFDASYELSFNEGGSASRLPYFTVRTSTTANGGRKFGASLSDGVMAYLVATWDGTNRNCYIDGSLSNGAIIDYANPPSGNIYYEASPQNMLVGTWRGASNFGKFNAIDEIRISNVARSANWIATCYNSQNSPSTFYSIGSQQAIITVAQATETDLAQGITHVKRVTLGQPSEVDLAQALTSQKRRTLGQPSETDLARFITPVHPKLEHLRTTFPGSSIPSPFADDSVGAGTAVVSDGQLALTSSATGPGAIRTSATTLFDFEGSSLFLKLTAPGDGAPQTRVVLESDNTGRGIYVIVLSVSGTVKLQYRSGGTLLDQIDYDPIAHQWLRLSESGGVTTLATAPDEDGSPGSWTSRFTEPTEYDPLLNTKAMRVRLAVIEQFPSLGDGTAYYDGVNCPAHLGQASETDLAQGIAHQRQVVLGQPSETDTAQAITRSGIISSVAQVTEADTAQAITRVKRVTIGQPSEASTAQAISRQKQKGLGQTTETDLAQAVSREKRQTVGQISETDIAQTISAIRRYAIGQPSEADSAQAIAHARAAAVSQTTETDTAQAISRIKRAAVGQVSEADSAQGVIRQKQFALGFPSETDAAQSITHALQRTIGQAATSETAQAISPRKQASVGQVSETDLAQAIGSRKRAAVGQVTEADTSQAVIPARRYAIGQSTETDTAQGLTGTKRATLGLTTETDLAQIIQLQTSGQIGQVQETDLAQALTGAKRLTVAQATETDLAQSIAAIEATAILQAIETDLARALTRVKLKAVSMVFEVDAAQSIAHLHRALVGIAMETATAQPLTHRKVRAVGIVTETDLARNVVPARVRGISLAIETDLAQGLARAIGTSVGRALETDLAFALSPVGGAARISLVQARAGVLTIPGMRVGTFTTGGMRSGTLIPQPSRDGILQAGG